MALNNLLSPRQQVQNSKGQPLAGGNVYLYLPGTTTAIPSYRSAELTSQNPSPVPLSSSGRTEIWVTQDCDLVIQDRLGNIVITQDNANPGGLGQEGAGLVVNGSFEIDADANNQPDGWTITSYSGSTNAMDSTTQTDGAFSYRFTAASVAGGGYAESTDFFTVNGIDDLRVSFDLISSITALRNLVQIRWYDSTAAFISSSTIYDSVVPPLVWTSFALEQTPPLTARFAKLRLIGVEAGTGPGSSRFDRIVASYPTTAVGIFGNITIQGNEIITTDANGDLNLRPNGTGRVVIDDQLAITNNEIFATVLNTDLLLKGNGTGRVVLYFNGVAKAATDSQGLRFLDPGGTDYVLIYSDGTNNVIDAVNPNALRLLPTSNALNGLRMGPANSAVVPLGSGTPSGGIQVGSTTSGAQTGYTAYVADGVRDWAVFFGVHDNDVWGLSCNPIGAGVPVFQVQCDAEVLLTAAQNGSVDLYHDNVATARTKTQATGGLEVKNLETGGGFERVLTTSDVTNDVKASYQGVSGQTITSGTMTDLSGLNFTPPRAGAYRFELHLRLTADNVLVTGVDFGINVVTGTTPPASSVVWKSVNVSSDTIDNIDESTGTFLGTLATVILGDTNAHYLKATGTVRFITTLPLIRLQAGRSGTGNVAIGPLAHMTWTYIGTP